MKNKYSDSLIPVGIGTSFFLLLVILLFAGTGVGYLLRDNTVPQGGGIILLTIFVLLVLIPILYNKKKSHFEKSRVVLEKYDGIGTIQGLRGALFRLIIYEEGIEIRVFYHRYYIPFKEMTKVEIEEGFLSKRLKFETGINCLPGYIGSSDKNIWKLFETIKKKTEGKNPTRWMQATLYSAPDPHRSAANRYR